MTEITHIIQDGKPVTDCCKKTPFELPVRDKLIVDSHKAHLVNCPEYGWNNSVKEPDA